MKKLLSSIILIILIGNVLIQCSQEDRNAVVTIERLAISDDDVRNILKSKYPNQENFRDIDLFFVDGIYSHRLYVLNSLYDVAKIFVLHDAELSQFEDVIDNFKYKFVYVPPRFRHTAILSNSMDVSEIVWDVKWNENFMEWI